VIQELTILPLNSFLLNDGGGEFRYDMFDILLRTFVNATVYPKHKQKFTSAVHRFIISCSVLVIRTFFFFFLILEVFTQAESSSCCRRQNVHFRTMNNLDNFAIKVAFESHTYQKLR
jgi:hypothetical protein